METQIFSFFKPIVIVYMNFAAHINLSDTRYASTLICARDWNCSRGKALYNRKCFGCIWKLSQHIFYQSLSISVNILPFRNILVQEIICHHLKIIDPLDLGMGTVRLFQIVRKQLAKIVQKTNCSDIWLFWTNNWTLTKSYVNFQKLDVWYMEHYQIHIPSHPY